MAAQPPSKRPRAEKLPKERTVFVLRSVQPLGQSNGLTEKRELRAERAKELIDLNTDVVQEQMGDGSAGFGSTTASAKLVYDFLGLDPNHPKIRHVDSSVYDKLYEGAPQNSTHFLVAHSLRDGVHRYYLYKHWTDPHAYIPLDELFDEDLFEPIE